MEVSSPGRICLFGEHQDYLGLPVIAMAMNLRLRINGQKRNDKKIVINLPDIGKSESFILGDSYHEKPSNIFQSGIKVCIENGLSFTKGFEAEIISEIPIQAGAGSSSALMVTWINFLSQLADIPIKWNNEKIAKLAYKADGKARYASPTSILIDDRDDNIERWKSSGGIGIKFISADQVINDLEKIGL